MYRFALTKKQKNCNIRDHTEISALSSLIQLADQQISEFPSVCSLPISKTSSSIYFRLGTCIPQDPTKCSAKFEVIGWAVLVFLVSIANISSRGTAGCFTVCVGKIKHICKHVFLAIAMGVSIHTNAFPCLTLNVILTTNHQTFSLSFIVLFSSY